MFLKVFEGYRGYRGYRGYTGYRGYRGVIGVIGGFGCRGYRGVGLSVRPQVEVAFGDFLGHLLRFFLQKHRI